VAVRRYRAAHDLGHFRFVECSRIVDGRPDGDVAPWQDLKFPFASSLRGTRLDGAAVRRLPEPGPEVEEVYSCSDAGAVSVTIRVPADGFARTWRLGAPRPLNPVRRRARPVRRIGRADGPPGA
jgi:hypothetical protein